MAHAYSSHTTSPQSRGGSSIGPQVTSPFPTAAVCTPQQLRPGSKTHDPYIWNVFGTMTPPGAVGAFPNLPGGGGRPPSRLLPTFLDAGVVGVAGGSAAPMLPSPTLASAGASAGGPMLAAAFPLIVSPSAVLPASHHPYAGTPSQQQQPAQPTTQQQHAFMGSVSSRPTSAIGRGGNASLTGFPSQLQRADSCELSYPAPPGPVAGGGTGGNVHSPLRSTPKTQSRPFNPSRGPSELRMAGECAGIVSPGAQAWMVTAHDHSTSGSRAGSSIPPARGGARSQSRLTAAAVVSPSPVHGASGAGAAARGTPKGGGNVSDDDDGELDMDDCDDVSLSTQLLLQNTPAFLQRAKQFEFSNFKLLDTEKLQASSEGSPEHRLVKREKQVLFGKRTSGYHNYLHLVPRHERQLGNPDHVHTPRASFNSPRRLFKALCQEWRKKLHQWDQRTESLHIPGLRTLGELALELIPPPPSTNAAAATPPGAAGRPLPPGGDHTHQPVTPSMRDRTASTDSDRPGTGTRQDFVFAANSADFRDVVEKAKLAARHDSFSRAQGGIGIAGGESSPDPIREQTVPRVLDIVEMPTEAPLPSHSKATAPSTPNSSSAALQVLKPTPVRAGGTSSHQHTPNHGPLLTGLPVPHIDNSPGKNTNSTGASRPSSSVSSPRPYHAGTTAAQPPAYPLE